MRILLLGLFLTGVPAFAEDDLPKAYELTQKWTIFQKPMPRRGGSRPLPKSFKGEVLKDLKLRGVHVGHPFLFGKYKTTGSWGLKDGRLQAVGQNTAVALAHAENVELEGIVDASGLGGWFMLLGWSQKYGNGYMVYNVEMKSSGSLWVLCEYRGFTEIEGTEVELNRFTWRKPLPTRLSIEDKKLTLQAGEDRVIDGHVLENYKAGDIIVGTYDTKYGPKPIRFASLRMRSK